MQASVAAYRRAHRRVDCHRKAQTQTASESLLWFGPLYPAQPFTSLSFPAAAEGTHAMILKKAYSGVKALGSKGCKAIAKAPGKFCRGVRKVGSKVFGCIRPSCLPFGRCKQRAIAEFERARAYGTHLPTPSGPPQPHGGHHCSMHMPSQAMTSTGSRVWSPIPFRWMTANAGTSRLHTLRASWHVEMQAVARTGSRVWHPTPSSSCMMTATSSLHLM